MDQLAKAFSLTGFPSACEGSVTFWPVGRFLRVVFVFGLNSLI